MFALNSKSFLKHYLLYASQKNIDLCSSRERTPFILHVCRCKFVKDALKFSQDE